MPFRSISPLGTSWSLNTKVQNKKFWAAISAPIKTVNTTQLLYWMPGYGMYAAIEVKR